MPRNRKTAVREPHIVPRELSELVTPRTRASGHTRTKNVRQSWYQTET